MKQDEIWTTRDGRKIAVGDMSEDHVRESLRMILRQKRRRHRIEARMKNLMQDIHYLVEADGRKWG